MQLSTPHNHLHALPGGMRLYLIALPVQQTMSPHCILPKFAKQPPLCNPYSLAVYPQYCSMGTITAMPSSTATMVPVIPLVFSVSSLVL